MVTTPLRPLRFSAPFAFFALQLVKVITGLQIMMSNTIQTFKSCNAKNAMKAQRTQSKMGG